MSSLLGPDEPSARFDTGDPGAPVETAAGGIAVTSVDVAGRRDPAVEYVDGDDGFTTPVGADGPDAADGPDGADEDGGDWAWVEEWRRSDERPAWGPGVAIAVFAMLVVASAVFVLSVGLSDMPWLAVAANVVVAAGLAPALWLCRSIPVLRFLALGAVVGVLIGWIAAIMN